MNVGDIIEVVTHHDGKMHLRRVQVTECTRQSRRFDIIGVNLRGKYAKSYALPLEPIESIDGIDSGTHWYPFGNSGEIDP